MTPRQKDILTYVTRRLFEDGQAPTLVEIGEEIGMKSKSKVHLDLTALVRAGRLVRTRSQMRGLALPANSPLDQFTTDELRDEIARREAVA